MKATALALCVSIAGPAWCQSTPANRAPNVTFSPGRRGIYRSPAVSSTDFNNTARVAELLRGGQLYLSLQDAIALSLENNLDIEVQRYGLELARTETLRAQGGGTLRGIPFTVNETPAGVGGPGSPLITTAASGVTPQTTVPVNVTDTQLIQEGQNNLGITGTIPLSNGPVVPIFDPAITGQILGGHSSTPQTNLVTTGTPSLNSNNVAGNLGYSQGFSPGTQLTGGFQNLYTDSNSARNLYAPFYNGSLGFTVTQPLLRGFGIKLNRRFIRIAKNNEKVTDYIFQQQLISTVSGVIRLYDDLVSLIEDAKVKQQTLATAERLVEDNRNKVEQGTIAPIELTRAQAQVAASRQDLINSQGYVRQQELILKNVIFRTGNADPSIHDARIVPTDPISVEDVPATPVQDLVQQAITNRPEHQAALLQVTNSNISLQGTRNELLPQVDLVGNVQNNGLAGPLNPAFSPVGGAGAPQVYPSVGGNGTALGQIFRRDYPSYSVGVNLNLPLRNRIAQADVARDEIQERQSELRLKQLENQIRLEVEDALIALQRTRAALDAASEVRKLQEQSLEIEQEKFAVGLSTNYLVIQYQGYVAQSRSTEVAARNAYVKARVQLERTVGQTLANNNVSIDEALRGRVARTSTPAIPPANP